MVASKVQILTIFKTIKSDFFANYSLLNFRVKLKKYRIFARIYKIENLRKRYMYCKSFQVVFDNGTIFQGIGQPTILSHSDFFFIQIGKKTDE